MNKKPDSYSQTRLDSISESSDRTELLSTKSTEPIMAIVSKDGQHHPSLYFLSIEQDLKQ